MASLMEELITTLEKEAGLYEELIPIQEKKTVDIINNDLEALENTTVLEQSMIEKILRLENKRQEVIVNIGTVINRNPESLDIKTLVKILGNQPEEKKKLCQVHDNLRYTVGRLQELNRRNQSLIEQSLDFIEFNMNFIQSTRMSPGNNYDRSASGVDAPVVQTRMFDAKQ